MTEKLMKDYKFNTRIEWTEEDRKRGECPVPDGSEVTVWFEGGAVDKNYASYGWSWGECTEEDYLDDNIIAYMIHSIPREPREWWLVGNNNGTKYTYNTFGDARSLIKSMTHPSNWEIIKVREVMEDDT